MKDIEGWGDEWGEHSRSLERQRWGSEVGIHMGFRERRELTWLVERVASVREWQDG